MWITPSRDKTLAELTASDSTHGGGSIPSYLLQPRRNQWLDVLNQVSPVIRDYIQRKKSDEIANQYLSQVNSPFAGSGAAAVPYQEKYQAYLNDQPDTATDDLNYLKLWRETHPDETQDTSDTGGMTPYQKEQTRLREMDILRKQAKTESGLPAGVPLWMYHNSQTQNFDPAQAFRDAQSQTQSPDAVPQVKTLDADTAKQILAEAGGDKEKARQIARERGYSF